MSNIFHSFTHSRNFVPVSLPLRVAASNATDMSGTDEDSGDFIFDIAVSSDESDGSEVVTAAVT